MEPQRTITALDRFKKATAPQPERTITALDRFKTGAPVTPPPAPKPEPTGLFRKLAKETPGFLAEKGKAYAASERAAQAQMSIGEKAKQSFVERPAEIIKFLAQGLAGGVISTGRTVQEALPRQLATVPGATKEAEARQKELEKQILGGDNQSAQGLYRSIKGYVDQAPEAKPWEKKYAPLILASAAFVSDIVPGKPNGKKFSEELLQELVDSVDAADIEERMVREGIDPRLAARTAPRIADLQDPKEIQDLLKTEQAKDIAQVFEGTIDETPEQPSISSVVSKYSSPEDFIDAATYRVREDGSNKILDIEAKNIREQIQKDFAKQNLENTKYLKDAVDVVRKGGKEEMEKLFRVYQNKDNYELRLTKTVPKGMESFGKEEWSIVKLGKRTDIESYNSDLNNYTNEKMTELWNQSKPGDSSIPFRTSERGFAINPLGQSRPEPALPHVETAKPATEPVIQSIRRGETPAFGFDTKRLPDMVRKEIERFALKDVEFAREINRAFNVSTKEDIADFLVNAPDGIDNDIAKTLTKNELIEELLDRVPTETILDIAAMRPSSAITPRTSQAGFIKNPLGQSRPEPALPQPKPATRELVSSPNTTTPELPTVKVANKEIRINPGAPIEKMQADDTVIKDIKELVRQDQQALRPTRATGNIDERDLAEEMAANIRRYNAKIPDKDIVRLREELLLGPETISDIILRKRGIITDAEAIERAKLIQGTLQDIIDLPKGTTMTKEQITAVRQIIAQEEAVVTKLKQFLDEGGVTGGKAERNLLPAELRDLSDDALLRQALAEATVNLKKAQIVELGVRSEAGRSLQATKQYIEGVDNRLRILFKKVEKSPKLGPAEKQAVLEQIAKMDIEDNKAFNKTIDNLTETDFFDKFAEFSVAAKLWNPTTHIVNFGGNALRQMVDIGVKLGTNPLGSKAELMGIQHGLGIGLKRGLEALTNKGYAARLSKYVELGGDVPAIKGVKGDIARLPFRLLGASDEIFSAVAYQRSLYRDAFAQAKKEGLKGKQRKYRMEELLNTPTLDMMERATAESKRMTFQEDMGEFVKMIDRLRDPSNFDSKLSKAGATGVRFFLPFLKTPVNLFKQAVDFSPFGIPKNYKKLKEAYKKGDNNKVATIIAESVIGTAIAAYIANLAMDGKVTGGAPSAPGEKDRFYRENKLPYAIKIGDRWYQYQRLDPFALIMGMTADLVNEKEPTFGNMVNIITGNLQDKTYLSGISDLIKLISGESWEQEASFKSMLLGATMPSIIGHTARSIDPNVRVADTIGERLIAQTPGLSEELPSRVNVLGYNVERANKGLNYFFNPIQSTTAEIDPVTRELMRIDYTVSVPNKTFKRDGKEYELTAEEYEDFARFTGIKLRNELSKTFKSPRYQRADADTKELMIDRMRTDIMNEWKDAYVEENAGAKTLDEIFNPDRSLLDVIFGN